MFRTFATIALLLAGAVSADARQGGSYLDRMPRGFVGVVAGRATSDAAQRAFRGAVSSPSITFFEAGGAVSPRLGFGIEVVTPAAALSLVDGHPSISEQVTERERLWMGLVRVRAAHAGPLSAEAVGGAGLLRTGADLEVDSFGFGANGQLVHQIRHTLRHDTTLSFAVGADVTIRAGRYFAVACLLRWHLLRRPDGFHLPSGTFDLSAATSSVRFATGVAARLTW
jgi:hypothetical protein